MDRCEVEFAVVRLLFTIVNVPIESIVLSAYLHYQRDKRSFPLTQFS